tara:strand:- start:6536 stop:6730 length:195 start_codon:yes stop_codon:yes gene_type:complete
MKWLLKLLGFEGSIGRKKTKLKLLQDKAFQAQRNGDLRLSGQYLMEAEKLETEIINEQKKNEAR